MQKIALSLLSLFLVSILCLSCSVENERNQRVREWMQPSEGKIKVLSTIAMIDDLVQLIGGKYVDSLVLIMGELDPHSYQLVKGDDEKLAFADLIFYNGLSLEHGPSLKKTLYERKNTIALGDEIQKSTPELILSYNGQVDPHIWMDVSLWKKNVPLIVGALSAREPAHAAYFASNGKKVEADLTALHEKITRELQSIPEEKRYLVSSHDAFNYFAKTYLATDQERQHDTWQKRFAAPEGLSPDSQLSASDIKAIVDHLQSHKIQVIFPESNVSRDSIKKIVEAGRQKGLDLSIAQQTLYADAMGPKGSDADSYMKMVHHNASVIALYLRDYNPKGAI